MFSGIWLCNVEKEKSLLNFNWKFIQGIMSAIVIVSELNVVEGNRELNVEKVMRIMQDSIRHQIRISHTRDHLRVFI